MEATATEETVRTRTGFWQRVKGGARKTGTAAKRAAMYVASSPKRVYRRVVGTKAAPGGVRRATWWTGRMIRKAVAGLGAGLFGIVQIAIGLIVAVVVFLAILVFTIITTVLGLICAIFAGAYTLVSNITLFFSWLASDEKLSFRIYRERAQRENKDTWHKVTEAVGDFFDDGDIMVTTESVNDVPKSERDRKVHAALKDKAALQVQADMDNAGAAFPGALSAQMSSADPYAEEGTWLSPLNTTLEKMGEWLEKNPEKTVTDFKFVGVEYEELLEALTQLRNTSKTKTEKSYWEGRLRALDQVHRRPKTVVEHGRAWALVYGEMKSQQDKWILKHVRTGFVDMMNDLRASSPKGTTRRGSSNRPASV